MALRVTIGQYYPASSPVHRADPRAKLVCTLVMFASAFLVASPAQLLLGCAVVAALVAASRVPAAKVLASVAPVVGLLLVLSLFNLFWTQTGATLVEVGGVRITWDGLWSAGLGTARLLVAILAGALLLLTTTPTELTDGLDSLLSPLARLGAPSHEMAMVVALTLRFVPILADEASAIMDAQAARAGGVGEGGLRRRVRAIGPIMVALFAAAMRHARSLARALDARCYEGGAARTHLRPLEMRAGDRLALALAAAYLVAIVALG